ncbi:MAG: CDP-alcohol phosphatidyltransferase family protein, partial [Dehalococcoidia bacterium]|nr:CDP-alcohol phosphatidyltransferase family protein [Dehalococcoidia bacterium]
MLTELLKERTNQALASPVRALARRGDSPNVLTETGLLLNALVGLVLALGWGFWGGFLVIFAGLFDMLDGALARQSGRTTRFGALLDSVVDRFSEAVILIGLLWFYLSSQRFAEVLLLFAVLLGSLMVSYVR